MRFVSMINEKIGKGVGIGLVLMIAIMSIEVVGRYVFNHPFIWTNELAEYLFAATVLLAGGWVLATDDHVRVDIFYRRLSIKQRAVVDVVTFSLFLIFCGGLLWSSASVSLHSVAVQELSGSMWNVPLYPVKLLVPIGAFLLFAQGIVRLTGDISIIRGAGKAEARNEVGGVL